MDISMFDPTIPAQADSIDYVPRPKDLKNMRVALVENTKYNSKAILLKLFEQLENRYQVELVGVFRKESAGHPVSATDIETCVEQADLAIAGIGD